MNVDSEPNFLTVAETAKKLGVHENTVRNWVKTGKLTSARLPGARGNRFDARDVERLLHQRGRVVSTVASGRSTVGPELVDASQLHQWADTEARDAQGALPELVRRLLSFTPGITAISVRSGDGVQFGDWDGEADSSGTPFLPAGKLRFEIGTSGQQKRKADSDWESRRGTTDAQEFCFVFVTSRRWRDGKAWAHERRAEGVFADVRVLDADDLAGWLESVPYVHYWISERLGRNPQHVRTLETWWSRFSNQTNPTLPPSFFLAGRDRARDKLTAFLSRRPESVVVQAKWRDDALAFVAAGFDSLAADTDSSAPPALVVTDPAPWQRLVASPVPTVLIPLFDTPDVGAALDADHHVVIPVGPDESVRGGESIQLDPPHRELARKSLEAAGVDFDDAYKLSGQARRSMPSFVRSLSRDRRLRHPAWVSDPASAPILASLALAGAWVSNDADWAVVAELADTDRQTAERLIVHWRRSDDPPFIRSANQWHVVSREEAIMLLHDRLTDDDAERWRLLAPRVLLEPDPVLDLDPEDRQVAGFRGIRRDLSAVLRRGLAEGLAAIAALEAEPLTVNTTCQEFAGVVASAILSQASADESGRVWRSLSDVLPLLAEAAPEVFLDAISGDLDKESPALRTMFQDNQDSSWLGSSSPHTGLLWALETLCWSPTHLGAASLALARLQAIDPGGRLANRPIRSLESALVYWIRHTSASLAEKINAVEAICEQLPDIGWQLVLRLWPGKLTSVSPPHPPRYRDWRPDSRGVPVPEALEYIDRLVNRAISLASDDVDRWAGLADAVASLPPAQRETLLAAWEALAGSGVATGDAQLMLWESLRSEVDRHRQFKDAAWAMDDATLTRLQAVADALKPVTGTERFAYLFDWHVDLPDVDRMDFRAREERLEELRSDAVREVVATGSVAELEDLARRAKVPGFLGWTLKGAAPEELESALLDWLEEDEPLRATALAWLKANLSDPEAGLAWLLRIAYVETMTSVERRLDLASCTPARTEFWDAIADVDPAVADEYWSRCHLLHVEGADIERAVEELLARDRPWPAIDLMAGVLHSPDVTSRTLRVEEVTRALDRAISVAPPQQQAQSLGYEVGVLLDYLEKKQVDESKLASYEFVLFRLIEHHRQPKALFSVLGSNPSDFVDLVSRVYRGKDEPERTFSDSEAALARHAWWVLAHWNRLPGLDESGVIDADHLKHWVTEARLLLAENDRADIGDEQIGDVLSNSPAGADGIWPAEPVREIIETLGSANIESGIVTGVFNNQGVTSRGIFDGGEREHSIASQYRAWSQSLAATNRRTSRVLRLIAESFEQQAQWHDADADITSDTE